MTIFKLVISVILTSLLASCSSSIKVETEENYDMVKLPDGSLVFLNQNSSIEYEEAFETRNVDLYGEALFNVRKGGVPFIINTGSCEVKVLGTKFNVKSDGSNDEVEVVEGTVELKSGEKINKIGKGQRYHRKVDGEIDIDKAQTMLSQELESDICKSLKEWFDLEIYNNFGIDVFSTSFDYEKKYSISQGKNTSHLLLKMEDLDEVFPKAIQEFLNIDQPIHITSTNIGDKKHYANIYKDIKGNIKLKPQKIDQIVNSDYFQQFYAQDQTKILKKWAED